MAPPSKPNYAPNGGEALPIWLKEFTGELDGVLDVLTPEERLAGLKPEEKQKLLEMLLADQPQIAKPGETYGKKPRTRKPKKES